MEKIQLVNIKKNYNNIEIIKGVNLTLKKGEFIVFVGPSGCGKSTLLRMIAGLEDITSGELYIDNQLMNQIDPSVRGISMVFQSYALYPHMTVSENMSFGLRMSKHDKKEIESRVQQATEMLKLRPFLNKKPAALSGGQRQRVAIGRAVVSNSKIFLFDEPLSNLDAELRSSMRIELLKLHQNIKNSTMIYVTHDQTEAMTLADTIVVLKDGEIEQIGSPLELYDNPKKRFVARFIGSPSINFFQSEVIKCENHKLSLKLLQQNQAIVEIPTKSQVPVGSTLELGIRPEHFFIDSQNTKIKITVDIIEHLGASSFVYSKSETESIIFEVRNNRDIKSKEQIGLNFLESNVLLFDKKGERIY